MFDRDNLILLPPALTRQNALDPIIKFDESTFDHAPELEKQTDTTQPVAPVRLLNKRKRINEDTDKAENEPKDVPSDQQPTAHPGIDYHQRELRMKKKLRRQQRTIYKLQQQIKQLTPQGKMKETLSEKILKHLQSPTSLQRSYSGITNQETYIDVAGLPQGYSQNVLLKKINFHLVSQGQPRISEEGHCHGITLLWLTMMSWGLESLFYKLVKQIAECPNPALLQIHKEIMTFLEWIDLGQSPEKHSNNTCFQQDVEKIIGVTSIEKIHQKLSEAELSIQLQKVSHDKNTMATITGWCNVEVTNPLTNVKTMKEKGHTLGLFYKNHAYCLYDCNYEDGEHKVIPFVDKTTKEARHRLFDALKSRPGEKSKYSLNFVTQKIPRP